MLTVNQLDLLDEYREAEARFFGMDHFDPLYPLTASMLDDIWHDLEATGMDPELIELHTSTY